MQQFAQRFLALRKEKGQTQEEVAAAFGVTSQSVSKWETGQSYPDITLLPEIATYFDVTVDYLLGKAKTKRPLESKNAVVHVHVSEPGKDQVNIKLPFFIVKGLVGKGLHLISPKFDGIDIEQLIEAVESGVRGEIINIADEDGTTVVISVD